MHPIKTSTESNSIQQDAGRLLAILERTIESKALNLKPWMGDV